MEEWKTLSLSQLKRLAKGRAGRITELQMELKIIEGIMDAKIRSGDFGGAEQAEPKRESQPKREEIPKETERPHITNQSSQSPQQQTSQEPLIRPSTQSAQPHQMQTQQNLQQAPTEQKPHPGFENRDNGKPKSSNSHAFKEID